MESQPQNTEFRNNPENLYSSAYQSVLTYVLGAQKNRLIETALLSTPRMFLLR